MPLDRLPRRVFLVCFNAMVLSVTIGCHSTMVQPATLSSGKPASTATHVDKVSDARNDPAVQRTSGNTQSGPRDSTVPVKSPSDRDAAALTSPPISEELASTETPKQDASKVGSGPVVAEFVPIETPAVVAQTGTDVVGAKPPFPVKLAANPGVVQVDPREWGPKKGQASEDGSSATPMIDAALKRLEQGNRLTVQDLETKPSPTKASEDSAKILPSSQPTPSAQPSQPSPAPLAPEEPKSLASDSVEVGPPVPPVRSEGSSNLPLIPQLEVPERLPGTEKIPKSDHRFEIANARLCRKVLSFGSTDRLASERLKPGQSVVLYAELDGLKDERNGNQYLSRLESGIRCYSKADSFGKTDAAPVWVQDFGTVEDVCEQRRRDFYVNYVVTVPKTLKPGEYILELSVTDLISKRGAKSVLSLVVEP